MKTDKLKLSNQLCFPLYICSKEIICRYKKLLNPFDLTYTQYIVMLALWEQGEINVSNLGNIICLDSGTLTPLLKKLEKKEYIVRKVNEQDERNLVLVVTEKGYALRESVKDIPNHVCKDLNITDEEKEIFGQILLKMINNLYSNKYNKEK